VIVLNTKRHTTKFSDHHTVSLIAHTANIVAIYLDEGLKGKLRIYLEISFDLEEEKEQGMHLGC